MRLTKFGHSCLLFEEGRATMLLDPGMFSEGFEQLVGLTAVLFTHQHGDHIDMDRLRPLLDRNPGVRVVSDEGTAAPLGEAGVDVEVVREGDAVDVGGVAVMVAGRDHATIHPDIPVIPNVGYLIGGRLFHPGDAFTLLDQPVELLALPASAPWLKASEAIDYLRAVGPKAAFPVHEKVLSSAGTALTYGLIEQLGAKGDTALRVIDDGKPVEL
jgi:L-ascorbate metabolism protein UlaG (beta-lactamase superfamily)